MLDGNFPNLLMCRDEWCGGVDLTEYESGGVHLARGGLPWGTSAKSFFSYVGLQDLNSFIR